VTKVLKWLLAFLLGVASLLALVLAGMVQPWTKAVPSVPVAIEPAALERHVRMLSETFHPRSFDHPEHLDAAARYVHAQFTATGGAVSEQVYDVEGQPHRNVIVRFGPSQGALLVIGAHYDSHGDAMAGALHPMGTGPHTHTPGADDNASGVAGLIELAKVLARTAPSRPVELVAYTLEEPPHFRTSAMGSAKHAQALQDSQAEVELMISLEMIGYFSDSPGSQSFPVPGMSLLYGDTGNFIGIVSRPQDWRSTRALKATMQGAVALPVKSINALPLIPGVDFSDHLNYWSRGYSAAMVTDTAFMRNSEYHRDGDTADRLDYGRMAQVVQGVAAFALRPAESP
jgi:Zn-dependent M28 family amino/carboxypeptidase